MLTPQAKERALKKLAKQRQQRRMDGYCCLHEFASGAYECDYVSPWSKTAHNVDAAIMVVGQDWASENRLRGATNHERVERGYDSTIPTNIHLQDLLCRYFGLRFSDTYATNAFPFIKPGKMQGKDIPRRDLRVAVKEFLLEQIRVVHPKMVICLGLATFNAIRCECGQDTVATLDAASEAPFEYEGSIVVAVAHTGARGTNSRGRALVEHDWKKIRGLLDELTVGT